MGWVYLYEPVEFLAAQQINSGRFWVIFWCSVRAITILVLGTSTFSKELEMFDCDTRVTGCTELCFNVFSPVSLQRYWSFQLLASGIPSILFLIYADFVLQEVKKSREKRRYLRLKKDKNKRILRNSYKNKKNDGFADGFLFNGMNMFQTNPKKRKNEAITIDSSDNEELRS